MKPPGCSFLKQAAVSGSSSVPGTPVSNNCPSGALSCMTSSKPETPRSSTLFGVLAFQNFRILVVLFDANSPKLGFMSEENTSPELTPDPPEIPETPPTPTDDPYANLPSDPAKQEKDWAMITHLSGLCSAIGIPSFVGPLVCWLLKKDEFAKVDLAGKEALNFQLS